MPLPSPLVVLAALVALLPGLWLWWTGRALLRRLDDPALAERVLLRQQRQVMVTIFCIVFLALTAGRQLAWALPLLVVLVLAAGYPARRALQQERWGLLAYVRYSARSLVGALGFWLLLGNTPQIVVAVGRSGGDAVRMEAAVVVAAALAIVLLAWEVGYGAVWLRLHRAVPFARARRWTGEPLAEAGPLLARFAAVAERAGLPMPRVYAYGATGGRLTNAIALPSRRPAVAFGNGMLDGFDADELTAIFAHELAHVEDYGPRRLRRLQLLVWALVVLAVALPLVTLATAPASAGWIASLYAVLVLVFLASRTTRRQAEETSSDVRAVEWTGDAEALVRGLEKLHAQVHLPRRMPGDVERSATHPSLARRIQAIRTAAGAAGAGAPANDAAGAGPPLTVLRGAAPGSWVALDAARAHWIEGAAGDGTTAGEEGAPFDLDALRRAAASYRSVLYGDLAELRVHVATAQPVLRAVDRAGRAWDFPLRADDVAAAQRALDRVDVRLSHADRLVPKQAVAVAASLVVVSMLLGMELGLATIPALVTLVRPGTASTMAMGATALLAAVVATVHGGAMSGTTLHAAALVLMAGAGLWALWLAWRRLRPLSPHPQLAAPGLTYALVGGGTLLLLARALLARGGSSLAALPDAPALAALAVLAGGLGAALAVSARRATRRAGGALLAAAAAVVLATVAPQAADRLRHRVHWTDGAAARIAAVPVEATAYGVELSPSGRRFAALASDEDDEDAERFLVGDSAGVRHRVEARDLAFVGDDSLLVLAAAGDSLELRLLAWPAARDTSLVTLWRRPMPSLVVATIVVDAGRAAWRVYGRLAAGPLYLAGGDLAGTTLTPAPVPRLDRHGYPVMATASGGMLVAAPAGLSPDALAAGRRLPLMATLLSPSRGGWEVWWMDGGPPHLVAGDLTAAPVCGDGARRDETLCVATTRTRTQAWRVGADGTLVRGALFPARLGVVRPAGEGRLLAVDDAGDVLLVDAATERGRRLHMGDDGFVMDADARGDAFALLVADDAGRTEVRLYRVR